MRKFICVRDTYTGFGITEPLDMKMVEAEDLDDLAKKLKRNLVDTEAWEEETLSPFQILENNNGDGADYYLIHELLPDGTLSPEPILG